MVTVTSNAESSDIGRDGKYVWWSEALGAVELEIDDVKAVYST